MWGGRNTSWAKTSFTGTSPADLLFAQKYAGLLVAKAAWLKATGGDWTDEMVEERKTMARASMPVAAPAPQQATAVIPVTEPAPQPVAAGITLYECIEKFQEAERKRGQAKTIGERHARDSINMIEVSKRGIEDRTMASITLTDLKDWIGYGPDAGISQEQSFQPAGL